MRLGGRAPSAAAPPGGPASAPGRGGATAEGGAPGGGGRRRSRAAPAPPARADAAGAPLPRAPRSRLVVLVPAAEGGDEHAHIGKDPRQRLTPCAARGADDGGSARRRRP